MAKSNAEKTLQPENGLKPSQPTLDIEELLGLPLDEFLSRLNTSQSGLASQEVKSRLETYGYNELTQRKKRTTVVEILLRFRSPLVVMLLIAGSISGFLGQAVNATIIFAIVLLSVALDSYQESKAQKAAQMLKEKVTTTASVVRDNARQEIKLAEIVPGDIINLSAGDIVPADARVITAKDLFIDQSALTGESFPVEKASAPTKTGTASVTECDNGIFQGTSVLSGTGTAAVMRTGNVTEYGKIAQKLAAREVETEFEKDMRRFGFLMMEVTFILVIFVFFINAFFKRGVLESLLFAVALAVGLTPELLPMIISVNLSQGALTMSKKGVIVKRLASIENFGSMDVLCTDKTGTLTENKITLVLHVDADGKENEKVLVYSYLNSYYETGLKSPLDDAILKHQNIDAKSYEKIDEVPFDFTRRRASIVVEQDKQRYMLVKGASEEIFNICTYYELDEKIFDLTDTALKKIEELYYDLSSQGFRILAVSYKKVKQEKSVYSVKDENDMVFLGLIAFMDPPKQTAKESLQQLMNAGVELKILTGDNELVTKKTCERIGFQIKGKILGNELNLMHDDALQRKVEETNVFARVTPGQKDRIMNALKRNGHVVGFLGDGINDAPSLKTADVSLSVDNAVDVAKESADIILLQKDLTVLQQGVLEGRRTFGNTMKYIMMGTSSNFGNMFSVAGASLFLDFLPMRSIQILLNNLLYDLSETTIPTDNVDPEYVEKPKKMNVPFIRRYMLLLGPISSIFDFLTFFTMLYLLNATIPVFQTAWFIESLCTQTFVIFVIRTRRTPFYKSKPGKLLIISSLSIVALALILPFTPIGALFELVPPPPIFYLILTAFIVGYLALTEIVKKWFYKRFGHLVEQTAATRKT